MIDIIQKEAKTLKFTCKDRGGNIIDVSTATCHLYVKDKLSATAYLFEKEDVDFNKADGINGILRVGLTSDNMNFNGIVYGILKLSFSATNIDKSYFKLNVIGGTE